MSTIRTIGLAVLASFAAVMAAGTPALAQQQQRPNIIMVMGDDIGWANIGVYNQGIMAGRTPNLDRLAAEGMRFTDYYAEASCTAGRAAGRAPRSSSGARHLRHAGPNGAPGLRPHKDTTEILWAAQSALPSRQG